MERRNGRKPYLPTHEPLFRQGFVGDLESKNEVEIRELLERQEKLLANRNFVAKLPDRGAKLERFVASLRDRLRDFEEESVDDVQSSHQAESSELEIVPPESAADRNETSDQAMGLEENLSIIEKGFFDLAIHEGPHYAVVKKAAQKTKPSKFMLNKMKKQQASNDEAVTSSNTEENSCTKATHDSTQTSDKPDISAATIRNPKNPSVLISIEESRSLVSKQQAIVKEQQSQLAAERILSKYVGSDSRFLSVQEQSSDDEDLSANFCEEESNDEEDVRLTDLDGVD